MSKNPETSEHNENQVKKVFKGYTAETGGGIVSLPDLSIIKNKPVRGSRSSRNAN